MRFKHILMSVVIAAATVSAAGAAPADTKKIGERIFKTTGMTVDSVTATPVEGLYEIVSGRRIFYADKTGKYLLAGQIFDTDTEINLTNRRMEEVSKINWKKLPLNDSIPVVYGNGERKVVVFTDAKCTYCSRLEHSFSQVGNVTVYNFLYPILNSRKIAENIWCARSPSGAFRDHMMNGTVPPDAKCDVSALDRNLRLGQSFDINGTPAIIFEDGSMQGGYLPADQLERRLNAARAK